MSISKIKTRKLYFISFYDRKTLSTFRLYIAKKDKLLKSDLLLYINNKIHKYINVNTPIYTFYKNLNSTLIAKDFMNGSIEDGNYGFPLIDSDNPDNTTLYVDITVFTTEYIEIV